MANRPTPSEVTDLVVNGILTKEEAREILFSLENDETRDTKSLQEEIKFLRTLVEHLTPNKPSKIVETIHIIEKPYTGQSWFTPYYFYGQGASGSMTLYSASGGGSNQFGAQVMTVNTSSALNQLSAGTGATSGTMTSTTANPQPFTSIKTF